jgi:hypothetical protein
VTQFQTVWRCQYPRGFYLIPATNVEAAIRRLLARKYARTEPLWVARHMPVSWSSTETSEACQRRHESGAIWPQKPARKAERRELNREAA